MLNARNDWGEKMNGLHKIPEPKATSSKAPNLTNDHQFPYKTEKQQIFGI